MYVAGIPHFYNLTEVENNAVRICRASHGDPRCVASSVTLAVLVALILQVRQVYYMCQTCLALVPACK